METPTTEQAAEAQALRRLEPRVIRRATEIAAYYQSERVTIYHGDAREVLPTLDGVDCVVTDPVWPTVKEGMYPGWDRPWELWAETAPLAEATLTEGGRMVVHVNCDTDPAFVRSPVTLPFLRVCWLRYARPHYKGRLLMGSNIAYVFGAPPLSRPGRRVLPGEATATDSRREHQRSHPSPRAQQHVDWLVGHFGDGLVVDPFLGSGSTGCAAVRAQLPFVGVEIEERYCEVAARRIEAAESQLNLFPAV